MPVAQINGHAMYYEIHGQGDPLICSGGWGTFCHGGERHVPEGLIDRHQVILFDHRAIGESSDDPKVPASTGLYADDVIGLLEHLGLQVNRLLRTAYGPFELADLPRGQAVEIRQADVERFRKQLRRGGQL